MLLLKCDDKVLSSTFLQWYFSRLCPRWSSWWEYWEGTERESCLRRVATWTDSHWKEEELGIFASNTFIRFILDSAGLSPPWSQKKLSYRLRWTFPPFWLTKIVSSIWGSSNCARFTLMHLQVWTVLAFWPLIQDQNVPGDALQLMNIQSFLWPERDLWGFRGLGIQWWGFCLRQLQVYLENNNEVSLNNLCSLFSTNNPNK